MARQLTYTEYYHMRPDEFQPGDEIAVKLVLAVGHGGDYAIYTGNGDQSAADISLQGDKITLTPGKAVGEALFRSVDCLYHYRR